MNKRCIAQECLGTTGFSYTLSHQWKIQDDDPLYPDGIWHRPL